MPDFPAIFNETEESVRSRMLADAQQAFAQVSTRVLDTREGQPVWLMLAGAAKEIARAYESMNQVAELAFVPYLESDFLTDKALEYGMVRLTAREANGLVSFYGVAGTSISVGAEVTTTVLFADDEVYSFETTESGTITAQAGPVVAPIISSGGNGPLTGSYSYKFTYVEVDLDGRPVGETAAGPASGNFLASNNSILVSGFPTPPASHRLRVYRTPSSGSAAGVWKLLVELDPSLSSVYLDSFLDRQLGSYFVWDGTAGMEYEPARLEGPVIAPTQPSVVLDVIATREGDDHNVAAGAITFLADGTGGVTSVMNHRAFITGRDDEDDQFFQPKVLERIQTPQGAGTQQDYISWLLEVPGIAFVTVHPHFDGVINRPGYVHCVVRDENNDPIAQDLLTIVREGGIIAGQEVEGLDPSPTGSGRGRAPIGAKVILRTVRKDFARVSAIITPKPGYSLVPATGQINLRVLVDGSLAALLNNLEPGATIYETMIVRALMETEGVLDVNLNLDNSNLALALEIYEFDPLLPGFVLSEAADDSLFSATGTWTLGKTQVLEYDATNSNITEV